MNYYLKAYILYTLLYSSNLLQIPLVPCEQSPGSNFFRIIDSMKKFDNGKIPCIKLYFGIPPQEIILGITFSNDFTWLIDKPNGKYCYNFQKSNSIESLHLFNNIYYDDQNLTGELSYDYFGLSEKINSSSKFLFLRYNSLHISENVEFSGIGGELSFFYSPNMTKSKEAINLSNFEPESILFLNYLKKNNQIRKSKIGITYNNNGGYAYIDEDLKLNKFCNMKPDVDISCKLKTVNFGNISISPNNTKVLFDLKKDYILIPGREPSIFLIQIDHILRQFNCKDSEYFGEYYILCNKEDINQIVNKVNHISFCFEHEQGQTELQIPTRDLFRCSSDNRCLFMIISNIYLYDSVWSFGSSVLNSNIFEFDYESRKIYFGPVKSNNSLNFLLKTTLIFSSLIVLLIGGSYLMVVKRQNKLFFEFI